MRIFITGSTGFIGSAVYRHLRHHEYTLMRSAVKADINQSDTFELLKEQIIDFAPDWILHFGSSYSTKLSVSPEVDSHTDLELLKSILDVRKTIKEAKFIVLNTACIYQPSNNAVNLNSKLDRTNLYSKNGIHKSFLLDKTRPEIETLHELLLFNIFGPDNNLSRLLPYVVHSLQNNLNIKITHPCASLDFLHIDYVVAFIYAIMNGHVRPGKHLVGTGQPTLIKQFVLEATKAYCMYNSYDGKIIFSNNNYSKKLFSSESIFEKLGVIPAPSISEEIKRVIKDV